MARMTLVVPQLSANIHVGNSHLVDLRSAMTNPTGKKGGRRPRIVGAQEMRKHKGFSLVGYDKFQSEENEWYSSNAIFLRKAGAIYKGHGFEELTPRLSADPIGAPRSIVWVSWDEDGEEFTTTSGHAPAGSRPEVVKARKKYVDDMIDHALHFHTGGRISSILGDLNDDDYPLVALKRAGFSVVQNNLDYVAVKRRGGKVSIGNKHIVPEGETHSDHPWVYAEVAVR